MIYEPSLFAIGLFILLVLVVLGLSFYFARRTQSSDGYFAAGGKIHWSVNGIAFAGDYLSAASFLGICGMIATAGYDGFLYSIGYLAGWVVALFIVAEPLKRLGKYTFMDALDAKFGSKGIQLTAGISTLVVSVCYLVPQMVGAGDLVTPLLGLPHYAGVVMVGAIVIFIVATAGMTSTTYVQFIKGGMLIVCSTVLVFFVLQRGLNVPPSDTYHEFRRVPVTLAGDSLGIPGGAAYTVAARHTDKKSGAMFVKLLESGVPGWWRLETGAAGPHLLEVPSIVKTADGRTLYNGEPKSARRFYQVGHLDRIVVEGRDVQASGPVGPFRFMELIESSTVTRFTKVAFADGEDAVSVYAPTPTPGHRVMRPGLKVPLDRDAPLSSKLNFISLMLALFFGTAALPHILIRYYTVPSAKCARKSTIVAIAAIGFFYILTMFMGLGAMINGVLDVQSDNMSAPLLAKSFGLVLFSVITALAFATVLGTVSGLIIAASGAVAHDIMDRYMGMKLGDRQKVVAGKVAAIAVGGVAILLGIVFKGMNVSFLVGLAFAVAASANLPSLLMLIFWKRTTATGIAASIVVGIVTSIALIACSPDLYELYGMDRTKAPFPFTNPGIVSIPLSFLTVVLVSLASGGRMAPARASA